MEQLLRTLYLIVLEYSPGLSEKQILEKQQPTTQNSRCLQEVVGSPVGRAVPLSVGVGVPSAPLILPAHSEGLLILWFFFQIPGHLLGLAWFPWGSQELL